MFVFVFGNSMFCSYPVRAEHMFVFGQRCSLPPWLYNSLAAAMRSEMLTYKYGRETFRALEGRPRDALFAYGEIKHFPKAPTTDLHTL